MSPLAMHRRIDAPFDIVVTRVKAALQAEGFGVLTEVDVKQTLAAKLGVEFRDYLIIGACNPPLAHRALTADLDAGVLLPCNVLVYADGDASVVSIFDPRAGMELLQSPEVSAVAEEARERLARALEGV